MVTKFDLPEDDKTPDHTPDKRLSGPVSIQKPDEQNFHHEKYLFNENPVIAVDDVNNDKWPSIPEHIIDLTNDIEIDCNINSYLSIRNEKKKNCKPKVESRNKTGVSCDELNTIRYMFR